MLFDQAFEMKCKYNAIYCNNRNRQIQMHESLAISVRPFINKTKFDQYWTTYTLDLPKFKYTNVALQIMHKYDAA